MLMRLFVSRKTSSHDQWLTKMQTTAYEAVIHLLSHLEEEEEIDVDRIQDTLNLSLLGSANFSQERRD